MHECVGYATELCSAQTGHAHVSTTVLVVLVFVVLIAVARWARTARRAGRGE